jgi:hypothetical protein
MTTSSVIGSTTTTTATTTTAASPFNPPLANIVFIIDESNGLNQSQAIIEDNYIANLTAQWTYFERVAIAEYGGSGEYNFTGFGTFNSWDDFRQFVTTGLVYYGDAMPTLAG